MATNTPSKRNAVVFADSLTVSGETSLSNITTTGYLRGPSTFTIDPATHGDDTGTVVIAGNLQVDGTTTTINSTTLTVDDKNITLASGSTNAAAADGAGITIDCGTDTDATFIYDGVDDQWQLNKDTTITGNVGIGTTNPGRKLDISAGVNDGIKIASANALIGGGASGGDTQLIYWNGSNAYYGRSSLGGSVSQHEFRTAGTTRLTIDSSGNIGIGTTSPAALLDVTSGIGSTRLTGHQILMTRDGNNEIYAQGASSVLALGTNGTEDMRIDSSGNLIIGATTPFTTGGTAKLSISGTVPLSFGPSSTDMSYFRRQAQGAFCWQTIVGTSNAGEIHLQPYGGNVVIGAASVSNPNSYGAILNVEGYAPALVLSEDTGRDYTIGVNGNNLNIFNETTNVLTILDSGNVGIGTTNPSSLLHLYGGATTLTLESTTNTAVIDLENNATTGQIQLANDYLTVAVGGTERMRIDSSGNVGIGTTSPGVKLDVSGDIRANLFRVENTGVYDNAGATTTSTTQTSILAYSASAYGGGKFLIEATSGGERHITELLITHNSTTAVATEYGIVSTNGTLSTYDVDISGGNVRILATPASATSTVFKVLTQTMFS